MFFWRTISLLRENLAVAESGRVHLENEIRRLEVENSLLRSRILTLEADEREIRLNLLRRSGVLPSEAQIDAKEREFKPVKKSVIPWSQQAAKLEADSKERYWKKQIELRERPQIERKLDHRNEEQADYDRDLLELNDVSSSTR